MGSKEAAELHFGRAAAREHIVQSALSQQLQRLERELGARLLERTTQVTSAQAHDLVITQAGERREQYHQAVLAPAKATACANVATGRSSDSCWPAPLMVHGLARMLPSSTAVVSTAWKSRYALAITPSDTP